MFYLMLEGLIPEEHHSEFEQTYSLVSDQMPATCAAHQLKKDKKNQDLYRFISYWPGPEEVRAFKKTPAYLMLNGAFSTLGELIENSEGKMNIPSQLS